MTILNMFATNTGSTITSEELTFILNDILISVFDNLTPKLIIWICIVGFLFRIIYAVGEKHFLIDKISDPEKIRIYILASQLRFSTCGILYIAIYAFGLIGYSISNQFLLTPAIIAQAVYSSITIPLASDYEGSGHFKSSEEPSFGVKSFTRVIFMVMFFLFGRLMFKSTDIRIHSFGVMILTIAMETLYEYILLCIAYYKAR